MNDYKSPEFWITALTGIVTAVIAVLIARGLLTEAEGQLWAQLAAAIIGPVAIVVLGMVAKSYTAHMTQVRVARLTAGVRE